MPSSYGPMTLGELSDALRGLPRTERMVYFDWCRIGVGSFSSYRGYYDHLALSWEDSPRTTLADLLAKIADANGGTFQGWKGGEYRMTSDTPVWVGRPGESTGFGIVGVTDDEWCIKLITKDCQP